MKTNFLKSIFYSLLAVTFITSCANDDDYNAPNLICEDQTEGLTANISGADLYAMATANLQQFSVTGDDYIEGYITSSDRGGNFFKTISFETADGQGMSIAIDVPNTYTKGYQVGRKILIKLNGLYFHINHGSLAIGEFFVNASGFESAGRIPENKVKNYVFFSCDFKTEAELTHIVTIGQAKNNSYINKLIKLADVDEETDTPYLVEFTETGVPYYDANSSSTIGGATNRILTDLNNNTLIFRTGSFAVYAGQTIPAKSGTVTGVMTKFNSDFQFVARDGEDIKLDQAPLSEQQPEPEIPGDPENLLFNGADFENWTIFNSSINSFGLQSYAVQGVGTGVNSSNSLHINGTPTANDYVYTILASAQGDIPASPSKITFWVKGTSAKSLSINVYRANAGTAYDVFNVGNLGTTPAVLYKAALNAQGNGSNAYGGTINTQGEWVKITLMISDVNLNTGTNGNLFALKVGSNSAYDLHIDNIEIE